MTWVKRAQISGMPAITAKTYPKSMGTLACLVCFSHKDSMKGRAEDSILLDQSRQRRANLLFMLSSLGCLWHFD